MEYSVRPSGDLTWFVRVAFFRRGLAAVHRAKPKIAIPAPIASFPREEHDDPFETLDFANRQMIGRTPGARHQL